MTFYVVEREKLEERHMCDNPKCQFYRTRDGMPLVSAVLGFQVCSMEKFDACSEECYKAISALQRIFCD